MKKQFTDERVKQTFEKYPDSFRKKLLNFRDLIFHVASENGIKDLNETLKWGEPSYISKKGSTLRIAWSNKRPNQYAMYFNCQTNLVETFRHLYGDKFKFEGNRAIIFEEESQIPNQELKQCILATLTYHIRKDKPFLGL